MVGARRLVAMAAAGSGVVRRVEELGDLAQAHIQQLSEAAGEDGEGAGEREAGGPAGVQSWSCAAVGAAGCGLWFVCVPCQNYHRCCALTPLHRQWSTPKNLRCLKPRRLRQNRLKPPTSPVKSVLLIFNCLGSDWEKGKIRMSTREA